MQYNEIRMIFSYIIIIHLIIYYCMDSPKIQIQFQLNYVRYILEVSLLNRSSTCKNDDFDTFINIFYSYLTRQWNAMITKPVVISLQELLAATFYT